ncbi:hypothetical protein ES288_D03G189500v1 [Gossypium darwinii]|uniref:C2 domain-containing protein n=2 Tax=Gossypium TaxID=3633 RepID=A0A5D2LP52_GOSTO|nr:hypothetical protein ES288_D03G189500v1 [Gossypium darwinii]TYH81271.1 hypothetical protein ES332_D03G187800v1 [Gossypium tomentosum]
MADNCSLPQFVMELTVLPIENLKKQASCGLFTRHLRLHISLTKFNGVKNLCEGNAEKSTFGESFVVPIESTFFANNSYINLQLHTKRLLGRKDLLGWCQIPAADIGEPPVGSVRYLSYKLRGKYGSRGNKIVDLRLKLKSYGCPMHAGQEVIGTPVVARYPPSNYACQIN